MATNKRVLAIDKPERNYLLSDVADTLDKGIAPSGLEITRIPGRTLPKGYQWDGHDIPGRGRAAARRLRQQEKIHGKA